MRYWVLESDRPEGPFETWEVRRRPGFSPDSRVCAEGSEVWVRAGDLPDVVPPAPVRRGAGSEPRREVRNVMEASPAAKFVGYLLLALVLGGPVVGYLGWAWYARSHWPCDFCIGAKTMLRACRTCGGKGYYEPTFHETSRTPMAGGYMAWGFETKNPCAACKGVGAPSTSCLPCGGTGALSRPPGDPSDAVREVEAKARAGDVAGALALVDWPTAVVRRAPPPKPGDWRYDDAGAAALRDAVRDAAKVSVLRAVRDGVEILGETSDTAVSYVAVRLKGSPPVEAVVDVGVRNGRWTVVGGRLR